MSMVKQPFYVIGYYKNWDTSTLPPENIDVSTYSHINYSFCGINDSNYTIRITDGDKALLTRLAQLKQRSNVKLLISIGGWVEGSGRFSKIAANQSYTENLAKSAISALETYNFDGLDIDWEYPVKRADSTAQDKVNFVKMLKTIREKFDQTSKKYLLTVAVAACDYQPSSYDMKEISRYVDFINVMTYDFHLPSSTVTDHNAPLAKCLNAINSWIQGGAPASKLVMGLPFYGHKFKLAYPYGNTDLANAVPVHGESSITYREISKLNWKAWFDQIAKVPFKSKDSTWISYDNPESIKLKVQHAKSKSLRGVMVWAINDDNQNGDLTKTIKLHC